MELEEIKKQKIYRTFREAKLSGETVYRFDFSGQKREDLPPKLHEYPEIMELNLSDNQFKIIPQGVDSLRNLKILDISATSISSLKPVYHLDLLELKCRNTKLTPQELKQFKDKNPDCKIIGKVRAITKTTTREKLIAAGMIFLLMFITYEVMMWITPTNELARDFLIGFGAFCVLTVVVAMVVRAIALQIKKAAGN